MTWHRVHIVTAFRPIVTQMVAAFPFWFHTENVFPAMRGLRYATTCDHLHQETREFASGRSLGEAYLHNFSTELKVFQEIELDST